MPAVVWLSPLEHRMVYRRMTAFVEPVTLFPI
jgi:hypothetical protein